MEPYSDLSAIGEAAEAEVKVVAVGALDPQPGDVLLAVVARVPEFWHLKLYITCFSSDKR